MTRATRSRQASALANVKAEIKSKPKQVATSKAAKEVEIKTRSNTKRILQDENAIPSTKTNKNVKNSQSKAIVLGSKLHSTVKDTSMIRRSTVLALKSPVLRDRTNTTNELTKADLSSKKTNEVQSHENKKATKKNTVKKAVKKNDTKLLSRVQVSIEEYVVKKVDQKKDSKKNSLRDGKKERLNKEQALELEEMPGWTEVMKDTKSNIDNKNEKENQEMSSKVLESPDSKVAKNKVSRRQNISIEYLEKLLNDDEDVEDESNKILKNKRNSKSENAVKDNIDNIQDDFEEPLTDKNQDTKKFFKYKGTEDDVKLNTGTKKNPCQANNWKKTANKRTEDNDSTFSLDLKEKRKSIKPSEKKLRPREVKNYCEESKLSESQNSNGEKSDGNTENPVTEKNHKGVPIYKTLRLSQESVKDKEEIYVFPEDSQENVQVGKKRKKTTRKLTAKRAKKTAIARPVMSKKIQKKSIKKVPCTVQFKEQYEEPINVEQNNESTKEAQKVIINNIQVNVNVVPELPKNVGESTMEEASTIKIVNDEILDRSKRINLTTTPPAPKTINSELKLFGLKNAITFKPKIQYDNMVNHSLIRKSISPIKKVADEFDPGSPWRPVDMFSRVHRIVQSTPQINRLPSMREKKLPTHIMNLNKKSFSSEDTILVSSTIENKTNPKEENNLVTGQMQVTNVSPRKFGAVISNISPVQSRFIQNVNSNETPVENNQSPIRLLSPQIRDSFEDQSTIPTATNKENTIPSPQKSPKKKFNTPSPFRFEKIRSSKRIASIESQSKSSKSISSKENKQSEPQPGPSRVEEPAPAVLRQSNLHNFLNLEEMPESSRISTPHGIFYDIHSTPINGKKMKKIDELNVENAFGFDEDINDVSSEIKSASTSIIATEKDVKESVKGKIFPNARVKSAMPSRISNNTVKKELIKTVLKKPQKDKVREVLKETDENVVSEETDENITEQENDKIVNDVQNNNKVEPIKNAVLDSVSFSDTFDVLSENGENIEKKIPEEIPLFVDLEPVHFSQPPRRSYNKRKRAIGFNTSRNAFESDEEEHEKPKHKKKKESKLSKVEQKRMQEWIKNINSTFDEIEHYDLVVE